MGCVGRLCGRRGGCGISYRLRNRRDVSVGSMSRRVPERGTDGSRRISRLPNGCSAPPRVVLPAYLSQNAGTMYANHLYAEGLRFLRDDPAYRCQMLLCHVPMAEDGTDPAGFAEKWAQVLIRFAEDAAH